MTSSVMPHTHVHGEIGAHEGTPSADRPEPRSERKPHSRRGKRIALIVLAVLGVLLAIAGIALAVVHQQLPGWIRSKVVSSVHSKCPACTMEIERVEVHWGNGLVSFHGIHYASDPHERLAVDARVEQADFDLDVRSLTRGVKHIERVELFRPVLHVRQNNSLPASGPPQPLPSESPLLHAPALRIDGAVVHDGSIEFTDHVHGRNAHVTFSNLDLDVGAVGTRPGLAPDETEVRGSSHLAGSGRLTLHARVRPLTPLLDAHYELGLRHLSLPSLNSFLVPAEGIHVLGDVQDAHATVVIHDRSLRGNLRGSYRDLDMHFDQEPGRGFFANLVANVGEDVIMDHNKGGGPGAEEPMPLEGHRGVHQAYFDFFWIALRQGIMNYIKR